MASRAAMLSKATMAMSIASPWLSSSRVRVEAPAVLGRSDVHDAKEHAPERLGRAETASPGDAGDALVGLLQQAASDFDARRFHIAARRHSDLVLEAAGEVAFAHARPGRHR